MNTTYEERSVVVQLVSLVLVLGGYFVAAGQMMARGELSLTAYMPLFVGAIVLMVVVLVLGHILALFYGMPEKQDERDRLINWRADSNGGYVLEAGVLITLIGMAFGIESVWAAHLLLQALLLHEIVKLSMRLYYYRRGV